MGHYTWDSKDLRYKSRIVIVTSSPCIQIILHEMHSSPSAGHSRFLSYTIGKSPSQKKDWLSLKTNHMAAHTKKKRSPDKLQNGREIEDRVFLHLQPDQQETRVLMKWSSYFFGPCKIGDHIGALTWRSDLCTISKLQLILQISHLKQKFKDDDSA
ncbi:hypothetical protein BHE74_00049650 [Ensete ventricosum]|nr:hypothetical protein BHE74_00049650 [Ensete ventricosum]